MGLEDFTVKTKNQLLFRTPYISNVGKKHKKKLYLKWVRLAVKVKILPLGQFRSNI